MGSADRNQKCSIRTLTPDLLGWMPSALMHPQSRLKLSMWLILLRLQVLPSHVLSPKCLLNLLIPLLSVGSFSRQLNSSTKSCFDTSECSLQTSRAVCGSTVLHMSLGLTPRLSQLAEILFTAHDFTGFDLRSLGKVTVSFRDGCPFKSCQVEL